MHTMCNASKLVNNKRALLSIQAQVVRVDYTVFVQFPVYEFYDPIKLLQFLNDNLYFTTSPPSFKGCYLSILKFSLTPITMYKQVVGIFFIVLRYC